MEGQTSDSLSEQRYLGTKFSKMLQIVEPPEMYELSMQCIYRVPPRLRENNPKAYTPRIVSIGPFHKAGDAGKEDNTFESMEELKLKYLKGFLNRTQLRMEDFVVKLETLEEEIRSCYAAPIKYNSHDFLKMILIDACFIIEHFLRWHRSKEWKERDPLLQKPWMQVDIKHDLILLENQLPFFVLEELYNLAGMKQVFDLPFLDISFNYFENPYSRTVCPRECPKHFTDLLRTSIIKSSELHDKALHYKASKQCQEIKNVYSASQLLEAGLKFKVSRNKGLLDLTYSDDGVLTMPFLHIDDGTEIIFRNIIAFEHCHPPDTHIITQYMTILDLLINTEKDVNLLVDKKIIDNWLGDANAVTTMVNSLCSNVVMPDFNSEYFSLCRRLNKFYENPRNKYKAIFIHEYFNTPWKIASTVAAIVLLLLTLIQTICSIISLF